mmetsp:Transcript_47576/g.133970  ORF Transcript_47576/g.133970 Transcript_47576/m.133970 type:complete len:206 (-) Transcript_47576:795-1412(-)
MGGVVGTLEGASAHRLLGLARRERLLQHDLHTCDRRLLGSHGRARRLHRHALDEQPSFVDDSRRAVLEPLLPLRGHTPLVCAQVVLLRQRGHGVEHLRLDSGPQRRIRERRQFPCRAAGRHQYDVSPIDALDEDRKGLACSQDASLRLGAALHDKLRDGLVRIPFLVWRHAGHGVLLVQLGIRPRSWRLLAGEQGDHRGAAGDAD